MLNDLPDLSRYEVKTRRKSSDDETVPTVIDDELAKLGWSENARLSLLGDIGRENAWNRSTIFGGHKDPANQKFNRGIISWQGDRRTQLDEYLKQEGVLGRADDEELRAMTRFLDKELQEDFGSVYHQLQSASTTYQASEALRRYIKYSPKAPYNSFDPHFRVKNNATWARKAQRLGLGSLPDLSNFENAQDLPDLSQHALPQETSSTDLSTDLDTPIQITSPDSSPARTPQIRNAVQVNDGFSVGVSLKPSDFTVDGQPVTSDEFEQVIPGQVQFQRVVGKPTDNLNSVAGFYVPTEKKTPKEEFVEAVTAVGRRYDITPDEVRSYADTAYTNNKFFTSNSNPEGRIGVTFDVLAEIAGRDKILSRMQTEQSEGRALVDTLPDISQYEINQVAGFETRLPAFIQEGGGHTSEFLGGVTRLLSPEYWAGTENLKNTVRAYAPNQAYPLLREHGERTRANAEYFNDGSWGTTAQRIAGNAVSDLPRVLLQSALPGGIVTASALDAGSQSAGRGSNSGQILKDTTKGAILGAIAKGALPVGKGIAANTGSKLAGAGGALAFTGTATYPTSRAFGATPEQALQEATINSILAVGDAAGAALSKGLPDLRSYESQTTKTAPSETAKALISAKPDIEALLGSPKVRTARDLRSNLATAARSFDQAHHALKDAREVFAKQSPTENFDFINKFENLLPEDSWNPKPAHPKYTLDPEQQEIATTLRTMLDEARNRVRNLGVGALDRYYENYFPHLFEQPEQAQEFFAKELRGDRGFLKQRTIPTFREALAAGLKPVSTNPVDLALMRINDLYRFEAGQKTIKFLRENKYVEYAPDGKHAEGFVPLPDNAAGQHFYGSPGAVKIIENFLSPSLNRFKAFRGYRTAGNFMTQANLALSGFHAMNILLDGVTSKLALGVEQLATGHPIRAGRSAIEALIPGYTTVQNLVKGDKLLKEWLEPNSDPAMTEVARLLEEAGGRAGMDEFWHTRMSRQFSDHLKQSEYFKATIKAVPALMDKMSQPIMSYLVPRAKLAAFLDLANQEISRLGPDAPPEVMRAAVQSAYDSVENRLGEMTMDNLFWNNTAKDLGMSSFQSLGWQLGSVREFAGAVKDTATMPKRLVNAVRGKQGPEPVITHRQAYVPAVVISTGLYGGMLQYLLSGKPPSELRDYFFPRNGQDDEKGNPARVSLPTYMKDLYAISKAPFSTVSHKLHPLPRLITQLVTNQTYFSSDIRDPDDPATEQLKDVGKHAASSFLPYSVKGAQQNMKRGDSVRDTILPFVGVAPAPKSINDPFSPAESIIRDFWQQLRGPKKLISNLSSLTTTPTNNASLKQEYVELMKSGHTVKPELKFAVKAGLLTSREVTEIQLQADRYLEEGIEPMTLDQALDVYEAATESERLRISRPIYQKLAATPPTPEQQARLKKLYLR